MYKQVILLLLAPWVLFSCTTEENETIVQNPKIQLSKLDIRLTVTPATGQPLRNAFTVTASDLNALIDKHFLRTRTGETRHIVKIEPLVYGGKPLMFFVQFNQGWKLFSIDKRMPVVLAENNEQNEMSVTKILANKAIRPWLDMMKNETETLAKTDDYDNDSESLTQWASLGGPIKRTPTKPVPGELIFEGSEYIGTTTKSVPHIVRTAWHTRFPFNIFTPTIGSGSTANCPLSCTAVATGQYMLHRMRYPGYQIPVSCSYSGPYTNSTYHASGSTVLQSDSLMMDETEWYISLHGNPKGVYTAKFLTHLAHEINVIFEPDNSGGTMRGVAAVLNKNGIKGKFVSGTGYIKDEIDFGLPVLFAADKEKSNEDGHMWLIDGYKYDIEEYDDIWRFFEDTIYIDPNVPREGTIIRERRQVYCNYGYQMNWGWDLNDFIHARDEDNTYYAIGNFRQYTKNYYYFRREQ